MKKLRWGSHPIGHFSVKEAYHLAHSQEALHKDTIWGKFWDSLLWIKIKTFLWLTMHGKILTWDQLIKRGFMGTSKCVLYEQDKETKEHLLYQCKFANMIWDWWHVSSEERIERETTSMTLFGIGIPNLSTIQS